MRKKKTNNRNKFWTIRSKKYDSLDWVKDESLLDEIIAFSSPTRSEIILDIGSGTGKIIQRLPEGLVIASDSSYSMLSKLENKKINSILCDTTILPFRNKIFDLITARMVFHHIKNLNLAIKECFRILKNSGRIVICEANPPDYKTKEIYEEIFRLKEFRHTFYESDLINLLHYNGFTDILLKPFYMKEMSLRNWLDNSGLSKDKSNKIFELHYKANQHFKKVYNLKIIQNDILLDWKFSLIKGYKCNK